MVRYILLILISLSGQVLAQAAPSDWPDPTQMTFEDIDFAPGDLTEATLSNGVRVYLSEDRSLPIITGAAYINAKAVFDPEGKTGLASFTANLLREGGAGGRSPEEVNAALEFSAASVEAGASDDLSQVSFSALADTIEDVLPIWRDVIVAPAFDASRTEVERERQLESIRRVVDDPVGLAVREFYFRVAEGHPSGAYVSEESISAISREDLISFHETYYQPQATTVAITGDFETAAMLELLESTLGSWEGLEASYPELPTLNPNPEAKIYYAPKDTEQTIILIGHPTTEAYSDAYNDFDVALDILGAGGFYSRLFSEIRTNRGLAYSTGAFQTQGFDYPGNFVAYTISRADATGEVLEVLLAEVKKLQDNAVSDAELERSRQSIVNQSLFRFTSPAAVTERAARTELLGLAPNYYEDYLANVQDITPNDVQTIMQDIVRPDEVVIMVVGDEEKFDRPLAEFGEVVRIELE